MSKLIERLASASKIKESAILSESIYTTSQSKPVPTPVPMVNVALSGSINGGITGGITTLAGPSKHFKTNFSLLAVASYLADDPEAVCLFYDSEFGSPPDYFKSFGIDIDRVMHIPVKDAEEFQFDIIAQLQEIKRKDKVIIVLDSLGNLASKKELEDAKNEKSVQDMSRAKKFKGLFRMVTPYLKMNDIPMFVINHTYKCGTKDMLVELPSGEHVSIADIKVGDEVRTEVGIEKVLSTQKYEDTFVSDIVLENDEVLSFTENHRFKVGGEWKYVHDLVEGDEIDCVSEL